MIRTKLLLVIIIFALFSCRDYNVKTIVNEDGSIEKIIKIESRDEIKNLNGLFFNIDSTWTIKHEKDSVTSSYTTIARRKFDSVSELIDKYGSPYGVVIEVNLTRRFRWFYTYYEYEEIIEKTNPFNAIKVEEYLTAEEYKELEIGEISEALSDKLNNYLQASAFEELLNKLKKLFGTNNLDTTRLNISRDKLTGLFEVDDEPEWLYKNLESIYADEDISGMFEQITGIYNLMEKKAERIFLSVGSNFGYEIELPGLILETNAKSLTGSTGYWKFDTENFTYIDYRMHILSRKANVWAMITTGGAVVTFIALLLVPVFRRRN